VGGELRAGPPGPLPRGPLVAGAGLPCEGVRGGQTASLEGGTLAGGAARGPGEGSPYPRGGLPCQGAAGGLVAAARGAGRREGRPTPLPGWGEDPASSRRAVAGVAVAGVVAAPVVAGCFVVVAAAAVASGAEVDPTVAARGWEQRAYLEAAAAAAAAVVVAAAAAPCRLHQRDYSAVAAYRALKASVAAVHCWGLVGSPGLAPSSVGGHC